MLNKKPTLVDSLRWNFISSSSSSSNEREKRQPWNEDENNTSKSWLEDVADRSTALFIGNSLVVRMLVCPSDVEMHVCRSLVEVTRAYHEMVEETLVDEQEMGEERHDGTCPADHRNHRHSSAATDPAVHWNPAWNRLQNTREELKTRDRKVKESTELQWFDLTDR